MRTIIVGGVAGGASCAARLRRLDESAEILMVERGPYVSYANCGLPYHIGGVIEREASLLVASERTFREQFAIDTRTNCEAVSIDAEAKTIDLRNVETGEVTTESYDKLVLSPGARSVRPPLPGIDLPGIFEVRTVPDARAIREWVQKGTAYFAGMNSYSGIQMMRPTTRAVVVGGGFIGLETAENLRHLGFEVTIVEMPLYVAVYAFSLNLSRGTSTAKGILAANVAAGVLTMVLYQLTRMTPYILFVGVMMLTVNLLIARMITSKASWAPLAGFGLSVLMILYGESILPFSDDGGSNFAYRFAELAVAAVWAIGALAVLEAFFPAKAAAPAEAEPAT